MKPRFTVGMARAFGRRPGVEPVPFQEILPLSLKNSVSGKGDKTTDVACLQEMAILFACMKVNEFNQELCSKEISSFQSCFTNFKAQKQAKSNDDGSLLQSSKTKKMPYQKLNKYLERYPQPSN